GSAAGVEAGTVLELLDPQSDDPVGEALKVEAIDRASNQITLATPGLSAVQQAAAAALPPGTFLGVRSREFRLAVLLLRQPDPAMPSRNETALTTEVFRYLSMDSRHSRYVHHVLGTTFSQVPGTTQDDDGQPLRLSDHRSEGESWYVRVRDVAQDLA